MTADTVGLERALIVMAICMAIQTLLCIAGSIAAFIAWRRTAAAVAEARAAAEAQIVELRRHLERVSATVDEAAQALMRGTSAVDGVVSDVRDAMGTVRNSVGSVASVVTGPRAALALGLWRGFQVWRKRRPANPDGGRQVRVLTDEHSKGDRNDKVERSGING
ncbi:MAG TPA: hypothetical protein VEC39_14820 [Vicinamibacterales bacterium]|nr:hypothetical protein [Vicinamibacterales bacterium]